MLSIAVLVRLGVADLALQAHLDRLPLPVREVILVRARHAGVTILTARHRCDLVAVLVVAGSVGAHTVAMNLLRGMAVLAAVAFAAMDVGVVALVLPEVVEADAGPMARRAVLGDVGGAPHLVSSVADQTAADTIRAADVALPAGRVAPPALAVERFLVCGKLTSAPLLDQALVPPLVRMQAVLRRCGDVLMTFITCALGAGITHHALVDLLYGSRCLAAGVAILTVNLPVHGLQELSTVPATDVDLLPSLQLGDVPASPIPFIRFLTVLLFLSKISEDVLVTVAAHAVRARPLAAEGIGGPLLRAAAESGNRQDQTD
jgi:hypothetical protein